MDEDLAGMSPELLIEEVKKLRRGIRAHRDSRGHELAGTTPRSGASYPRSRIRFPSSRSGPSSSAVVYGTGSR